jgi:hypothetical protein
VRRALRKRPPVKYTNDMRSDDSINSKGSRDGEQEQISQIQASLGISMCESDPRYITHEGDSDRGDVIIPMSEMKKLISLKEQVNETVATVQSRNSLSPSRLWRNVNQLWIQRKKNSNEKFLIYINNGVKSERNQQTTKPGSEHE